MSLTRSRRGIHSRGLMCAALVAILILLATASSAMAVFNRRDVHFGGFAAEAGRKGVRSRDAAHHHNHHVRRFHGLAGREGDRFHARQEPEVREREHAAVLQTPPWNTATTTAAVQAACGASIVGQGFQLVNNGTGAYPGQNPVLLVSGGPTTLYIWSRIAGSLTVVVTGIYNPVIDVTGLPNTPGAADDVRRHLQQEEDRQEQLLRDGPLQQEEEDRQQRHDDLRQRPAAQRHRIPEVQAEEVQEEVAATFSLRGAAFVPPLSR